MTAEILEKNLLLLKTHHPNAYGILIDVKPSRNYEVSLTQSNHPTLTHIDSKGTKKYLLSKYDPAQEAKQLIKSLNIENETNFIILGIGLGYQISELIKTIPEFSKIIVIENDLELARLAFETTNLSSILKYPGLTFIFPFKIEDITTQLELEKFNLCLNGYCFIRQKALYELNKDKNNEFLGEIKSFMQASSVELKTQRKKSKIFYKNISKNFSNLISSEGVNFAKSSLCNIPAIICSAGPSLEKNIQLLKSKRNNFVLVSVATALKTLLANEISPDFVIAVDPEEITLQFFDLHNSSANTCLVYDPIIPSAIPKYYMGRQLAYDSSIHLAQWFQKNLGEKGSLGKILSVAHAAFQFSKLMGCSPKIFIGQDLSFEKYRLHARNTYYSQIMIDQIGHKFTMNILSQKEFFKYSRNIIQRKGIFDKELNTTISLDTYARMFSDFIENSSNTYNATEGGIGIEKAPNITLREAISKHCQVNVSAKVKKLLNSITTKPLNLKNNAAVATENQVAVLNSIAEQLENLEEKVLLVSVFTDQKKLDFIQKMKAILENILKDKETTLLLQGYDFLGFSIWNQRTNRILNNKKRMNSTELLQEEFQRDFEFFEILKESVKFNITVFDSFLKEVNAN